MFLAFAFLGLLRFLLPFAFITSQNDIAVDDTISWPTKRLTWNDFTGRVDPRYMTSVALTSSSINVFYHGREDNPTVTVTCTFYRNHSWVKPEGRSKDVLQHEQLHFDISELYARKLRRDIAALPKSRRDWETVKRLYDRANDDCADCQARYDHATHHSVFQDVQQQWNQRVAMELNQSVAYASK